MLDGLARLNQKTQEATGDPEIMTRIAQYEMAYRMQTSVPELADISAEPKSVLDLYGPEVTQPGTFTANCLLARRLAERGVRFTQVYIRGWDHHGDLARQHPQASEGYRSSLLRAHHRPQAARALRRHTRRLGRRVRPHHLLPGRAFAHELRPGPSPSLLHASGWRVGGAKRGFSFGETDDFSYNVIENPFISTI
jgi:hypothetical protein